MNGSDLGGRSPFEATFPGAGVAAGDGAIGVQVPSFTDHADARGRLVFQTAAAFAQTHSRERSAFTAAGRLRRHDAPDAGPSVEQWLLEQNRLLTQQVQMLQSQVAQAIQQQPRAPISDAPSRGFLDPKHCIEGVDPALKCVFEDFAKESRHMFTAWETQRTLHEKYSKLVSENKLHTHFEAEASLKWQFTKLYIAQAKPVACEACMSDDADDYDLLAAWQAMRARHAEECFEFVCQHQEQCLNIYEAEVSVPALQQKLQDRMQVWFAEHGYTDDGIKQTMSAKAVQFVDSLVRQERPAVQSRMNKQKQVQQKREQAVLEAKSKWESMDVKDVLSPALFELAKLGGSRRKPITLNDDSALAFLAQNNAELMEKHKLKIVPASSSKPTSSKRTPTPKRAAKKPEKKDKRRQQSRGRSSSGSRHGSRRPSSRSSGRSSARGASSGKQVRFADEERGKGKGKGKGKNKQKRK